MKELSGIFSWFFLPHIEYVRMRKDLVTKERETKQILGQKVPSATEGKLQWLKQQWLLQNTFQEFSHCFWKPVLGLYRSEKHTTIDLNYRLTVG